MIHQAATKIKSMITEHKHVMAEHKHMMWFHILIAILVWVVLHMLFPPVHADTKEHTPHQTVIIQEHNTAADIAKEEDERIEKSLRAIVSDSNEDIHEIPSSIAAPNLSLKITADVKGWYNLFLGTENFAFTPQRIGVIDEQAYYEGHASLYVNDQFVSRVYSPYHFIPEHMLQEESNVILVTLNDNVHDVFTWNGEIIYDADTISQ